MVTHWKLDRREFLGCSTLGTVVALLPTALQAGGSGQSGLVTLEATGDAQQGYGVALLYRGQRIAHHQRGGEFSALFQNSERSLEDQVESWKSTSWKGGSTRIHLAGTIALANLRTTVYVEVTYQVLASQVITKTIQLRQNDMFTLHFQLSNRLEPETAPEKLWSFDQADCRGGALRENFPAAGFRTKGGVTVGLLTDAGYRNQWSRIVRRDGTPLKPAPTVIADLNLYVLPSVAERARSGAFIQQTFGETTVQLTGERSVVAVELPPSPLWVKHGAIQVEQRGDVVKLTPGNASDFVLLPFGAKGGDIIRLRLKYRCAAALGVHAWDVDDDHQKRGDITLFNDTVQASAEAFMEFDHSFVVPALQGSGVAIVFSPADLGVDTSLQAIELRDIEAFRISTKREPVHQLEMGRSHTKRVFIFASDSVPDTLGGYRLASQIHLADAFGFKGGETEKVIYADLMMLTWSADVEARRQMLAPSIWYSAAGEMYLRDSFYALNGIHNRELNESVFALWGENQGIDGAINTLVEPNIANLERKSNDSTPLWLIWALQNRRRFGTKLPMEKIVLAANYCLSNYDPAREGVCHAQFVIGQLDVISYPAGTNIICENQGMLAVLLRVIRELQIPGLSASISQGYIAKAEAVYRSYYDSNLGFMLPARNIRDALGFADIFPEFLSLWLFRRKILTDEMVNSHLNRLPVMLPNDSCPFPQEGGTVRPIFIGLPVQNGGWRYFTDAWHPMVSDSFAKGYGGMAADGIYYNGGSWMRIEICGYVTGKFHGWRKSERAIANRLWAEIHTDKDFPTSHEYLPTDPRNRNYGHHRVFAWNSFVLQALEMAGLRRPEMDPDYLKPGR